MESGLLEKRRYDSVHVPVSRTAIARGVVTNIFDSLFLEWARLLSLDREEMNFELPDGPDFDY